ncbi:glycerol-3-phosphate 1-O-acyltransferase [Actinomycetospora cinnamomea]|uniref:Glycerol-3-phosphate acyltransferase n=1 Tax=Actinomycetospora cinnamomea TaxID=663609 RepID=A0A2U1FDJ4_9PSEU|nr:glycerol-3-phosphate 1-O-acyltransferase [Actinomycetospora cinnamomea]PVZ10206.1 glycerol-3-phosphate acyltransferase [Actinomycetospora cinnamomea]
MVQPVREEARRDGSSPSTIVLSGARSRAERELVRRWAASTYGDDAARIVADDARELSGALEGAGPDTAVVPVRVVWPPAERSSADAPSAADLLSLSARRRGLRHLHARLRGWSAEKARVVAGEAATLAELRRDGDREVGTADGTGFVAFVRRRATLACDRAERRLTGDRYKVPRLMAEQIVASAAVRRRAGAVADELGLSTDEVLAHTARCLEEMAAVQSPPAIEAFRSVMSPLHRRAWDLDVDDAGLEALREEGRRRPLVFLPSHRSYADPLVLAEVLHAHDFPRNHVLGGNNLAFWPLGALGRRAGIVFIRRSFGDDTIYKFAVREYFGHLLDKRFNLEWYIEGGRTRTGKLRPPRYGLLRYLVDAADQLDEASAGADPLLVPVSINYDQLHEVGALAAEQGGTGKKAEGLAWLAGYMRDQQRRIGSARIRFGEPIGLRDALAEAGEGPSQLEKVAFRVAVGINRAAPATPTGVVTFALLGACGRALTLDQVRAVVAPVRGLLGDEPAIGTLDTDEGLVDTLCRLVSVGVVECFEGGPEPVWSIGPDRHHVAAFYRNGLLHHLLTRAVLEMALFAVVDGGRELAGDRVLEACWEAALALRDLLKYEFFFSRKRDFRDELLAELDRLAPGYRSAPASARGAAELLSRAELLVAPRTLLPFVEAQWVVATVLAAHEGALDDRASFLDACTGLGRQWWRQQLLHGADVVSRELFTSALRAAENRALLGADADPAARAAWRDEVAAVRNRLRRAGEREQALRAEVFDDDGRH